MALGRLNGTDMITALIKGGSGRKGSVDFEFVDRVLPSTLFAILSRLSLRRMSTAAAAPVFDPKVRSISAVERALINLPSQNMIYKNLGNTGLKVSVFSYGGWLTGGLGETKDPIKDIMRIAFEVRSRNIRIELLRLLDVVLSHSNLRPIARMLY